LANTVAASNLLHIQIREFSRAKELAALIAPRTAT